MTFRKALAKEKKAIREMASKRIVFTCKCGESLSPEKVRAYGDGYYNDFVVMAYATCRGCGRSHKAVLRLYYFV